MNQVFVDGPVIVTGEHFTITPYVKVVAASAVLGVPAAMVAPVFTYYKTRAGERLSEDSKDVTLRKAYFAVEGPNYTIWEIGSAHV